MKKTNVCPICTVDLHNSPEKFVAICRMVGFCICNRSDLKGTLKKIREYAFHSSWRIREAVAIGIQEMAEKNVNDMITGLEKWVDWNDLEKRWVMDGV